MELKNIYALLNEEAKNWWYHKDLRKQGNIAEARKRERHTIKNSVEHIRQALKHNSILTIRNHGYSLIGPNSTLSGYGNIFNDPFIQACYKAGVKIVEQRSAFERARN